MTNQLTSEQDRVFSFIVDFRRENGFPPTVREIAGHFHYRSANNVRQHLRLIERKGYIRVISGKARGIEVTAVRSEDTNEDGIGIPLVGAVAAGKPITAVENLDGYVTLDRSIFKGEGLFALRIKGNSMRDIGILSGDIAVVRQKSTAENGEVVVAIVEGEATLKRYFRQSDAIVLHPENSMYNDIVIPPDQDVQIAGKLVGVIRKY